MASWAGIERRHRMVSGRRAGEHRVPRAAFACCAQPAHARCRLLLSPVLRRLPAHRAAPHLGCICAPYRRRRRRQRHQAGARRRASASGIGIKTPDGAQAAWWIDRAPRAARRCRRLAAPPYTARTRCLRAPPPRRCCAPPLRWDRRECAS